MRDLVTRLFDMAEQRGMHVLGVNGYVDPTLYRPHRRFAFSGMLSGHCFRIRRSDKLRSPDKVSLLTDDLYISALTMYHHRFILRGLRYGLVMVHT